MKSFAIVLKRIAIETYYHLSIIIYPLSVIHFSTIHYHLSTIIEKLSVISFQLSIIHYSDGQVVFYRVGIYADVVCCKTGH